MFSVQGHCYNQTHKSAPPLENNLETNLSCKSIPKYRNKAENLLERITKNFMWSNEKEAEETKIYKQGK